MAKEGSKTRWSLAEDRRLIQLAASLKSLEAVADEMKRSLANVARTAKRLGVSLTRGARPKGKGKMNERHLVDPTPELPDDTPIEGVRFPTRIRNVLAAADLKTVGEVRETADETLLSFPNLGPDSVADLRKTLGVTGRPAPEGNRHTHHPRRREG
jgi:DNA-directed RNA polymerase alpha subunit